MNRNIPQCEAITLIGYRRCRKPGNRSRVVDGRERAICSMHDEWALEGSNIYFDSPEYIYSPGYLAKTRSHQTAPGLMTFQVLERT